jgi:cyclopropane fatty-acyl-phospholipid synthase-like methyltransferase
VKFKTFPTLLVLIGAVGTTAIFWAYLVPTDDVQHDLFRSPDIAFTPTPLAIVEHMLDLAELKSGDVLFDLGSGDGRIVIEAGEKYAARAMGVEIDPDLVILSRSNVEARALQDRVVIEHAGLGARRAHC